MHRTSTDTRIAELEAVCLQLRQTQCDRLQSQDEILKRVLTQFGRMQGQFAVMGYVASTLMQAVEDPVRLRLTACLQVAAENFPIGLPANFEDGFRESAEALIPDIWELH